VPIDFQFDPDRTVLGTVFTHAGQGDFALSQLDRMNHMLVIGKTGMGKTKLLKNIILQDIHTGRGVGVIDPHGDLQNELLNEYPAWRARDLVYLDPNDSERVVTCNVLADVPTERIAATTSEIVAGLKANWPDSWGPRMERILYYALAALIEAENTSLLGLPRFLKDATYREQILEQVEDRFIHQFFDEEYAIWDDDYRTTAIDPVLNKAETLLASPVVRAILGTTSSSITFDDIMDNQKVFIANLGKGLLGPGHAHLLGTVLVSGFSNAAARRGMTTPTNDPRTKRVPFHLHVDEVENFITDTFGEILSEARKWGISLTLAHQFLEQLPPKLRSAVIGNVGSIIAFQIAGEDADVIARELALKNPDHLTQLSRDEVCAKHASFGGPYHPRLLSPIVTNARGREAALKQNILRNTYPRARVDEQIDRFLSPPRPRVPVVSNPVDRWPLSLRVLRTALRNALDAHGVFMPSPDGGRTITAVDIQHVRRAFIELRVADAEMADERAALRDKAFRRAVESAQQRRLLAANECDGVQWIWIDKG
jgi:uncharacterized protein DUF87